MGNIRKSSYSNNSHRPHANYLPNFGLHPNSRFHPNYAHHPNYLLPNFHRSSEPRKPD